MIRFSNMPRLGIRLFGSWLGIGLLVLVIYLLLLDQSDRKPFLVRASVTTLDVISGTCNWAKGLLQPQTKETERPQGQALGDRWNQPDNRPLVGPLPYLPMDFQTALAKEVARFNVSSITGRWNRLLNTQQADDQIQQAVDLAIDLPRRWWPVNGRIVDDQNLQEVLAQKKGQTQ